MARPISSLPSLRRHKATNQAVVTVRLANGHTKDLYLGRHGTAASRAEHNRVVAILLANGGVYPMGMVDVTVSEALVRYTKHVVGYYVALDGTPTGTADDIKIALGYLRRLFGPTPLTEFGISEYKTVRQALIDDGRVRSQVNRRAGQVRAFVRWCVEESLPVAPGVLERLRAVRPLSPGRDGVPEGEAREPADPAAVEKVLPLLSRPLAAMVRLLRLTGARPSEILRLKPCEIDRTGEVWAITPTRHKGSWRGKARVIYVGPDAQAVLTPWLLKTPGPDAYVFSPARAVVEKNAERSANRKTPLYPSHAMRNATKRKGRALQRRPREYYVHTALSGAVWRACEKAGVKPFSPYSLRHLKAVELREKFGLEHVRAVLGHSVQAMSDHYSKAADKVLAAHAAKVCG